jgi:antitoxin PrlF
MVRRSLSVYERLDKMAPGLPYGWHAAGDRGWVWTGSLGCRRIRSTASPNCYRSTGRPRAHRVAATHRSASTTCLTGLPYYCYTADVKITLKMTSRGVITLPAKLRRELGLSADDHLIAETTAEGLLLRPAITLPIEMYTADRISEFDHQEAQLATLFERKATVRKRPGRSGRKPPS